MWRKLGNGILQLFWAFVGFLGIAKTFFQVIVIDGRCQDLTERKQEEGDENGQMGL